MAIIGMGCMFPQAEDLARYWANIRNRIDAITEVPDSHWRVADYHDDDPKAADRTYAHRGGFLSAVDFPLLDFGIAPHSIEATDTTQLLGLLVARRALEDAGCLVEGAVDRDRVSVILGVTGTLELVIPLAARLGHPIWRRALAAAGVDDRTAADVVERIASSYVGWQEGSFPGLLGNVAAGRIANRLDLRGTNCVVDAACASSLGAVNLATLELAAGRCDLAVTGGLDTFNDIFMYMCFSKTPALSPTGDARPFDAEADGTILGEGLGVMVLKRLADARRDGNKVYAVIRSIGTSSDGKGQAVYAPSTAGQAKALRQAYDLAGIEPGTIELVEAHGTGTKVGDAIELAALEEVYGGARAGGPWCALGSVKSQVGHTKAAAGAAGLIKAALALYHKVVPPTSKVRRPIGRLADGSSPFYVNTESRPWLPDPGHPRRAAVSAFGFGGSNFHCVLEEAEPAMPGIDWDGDVQILAFSADQPAEIGTALEALEGLGDWGEIRRHAARGRSRFQADHRHRLLLVVCRDEGDAGARCAMARARLASWSGPDSTVPGGRPEAGRAKSGQARTFLGMGPRPGHLAMLFPGQGSQYVGMLRELACQFPRMQASLSLVNEVAGDPGIPFSGWIYPRPAFGDLQRQAQEVALRDTRIAQPAIAAVSLGLLRILEDFGVRPDVAGGHSFGELTALLSAGRFDDRSLAFLAQRRGALMAECAALAGAGAMLAVFAPLDEVRALIREQDLGVVIANKNAPRQCVLSGPAVEIERSRQMFGDRRIATHAVAVSAAFHSGSLAGAEEGLRQALDTIDLTNSTIPVFANATALPYPEDVEPARALLASQLVRPVEFVAQIEAMYRMGARTFLEVGPEAKLTTLVRAILEGRPHLAVAVDASRGSSGNQYDLACALASLAALGYAVDLGRWDPGDHGSPAAEKKTGLTVRICGANARPKVPATDEPRTELTPLRPERGPSLEQTVAARPPRFSRAGDPDATMSSHSQGRGNAEIDRTMDPSDGTTAPHLNGQASSHSLAPRPATLQRGSEAAARPPLSTSQSHDGLSLALSNAQDNLIALQRLAEQTAAVHRQFLEGQEKAQQTLLRLFEHQQRLSLAMLGPAGAPAPTRLPHAGQERREHLMSASGEMPALERSVPPEQSGRDHDRETGVAAGRAEPAATSASAPFGSLAAILVGVVAEKTGYPAEVLDLDMQLDADLGIDSIKRVEILSAVQDKLPDLPSLKPEQLGSFRSLRSIVEHMSQAQEGGAVPQAGPLAGHPELRADRTDLIARALCEAVAEKTGYPIEMLELDMKVDVDLGIDSIKRVEILSAVQDRLPELPSLKPEQLGALSTLGQIADALSAPPCPPAPAPVRENGPAARHAEADGKPDRPGHVDRTAVRTGTENGIAHQRENGNGQARVRQVVLRRLHPCCRPLEAPDDREEIRLRAGGTIWITQDGSPLTEAVRSCLVERGYRPVVVRLDESGTPAATEPPCGLIILAPREPDPETFIGQAFRVLRAAAPALERSGARGGAVLLTVSRLDGRFGVNGLSSETSPVAGGLAGMAKTAGQEWPGVHCKAVDLDPAIESPEQAAASIVEELFKRGPAEVGVTRQGRIELELRPDLQVDAVQRRHSRLERGDLVVISGGARGITAEVAVALAESFQPRLVVLGRSPAPVPEADWLAGLHDEAELKRALLTRSDRPRAPQELGEESRRVLVQREVRRNLARITEAGSPVVYRSVDVRDRNGVRAILDQVRAEYGTIRGLIHGAGVVADRRIADQTDAQFDQVYDTKVKGLAHLFEAIDPESLAFLILFSSSTARFGRTGQVAYAAANEALNKWAQRETLRLPHCRVVSYNWGPWAGGMVKDALRPLFEKEGLTLIPPAVGARLVVDEIGGTGPAEIVVLAEPEPADRETASSRPAPAPARAADRKLETVFRRTVGVESMPILASHVIDGNAVLPMAIMMEWLAEGAAHRNPGLVVSGLDDVRLFKGVILKDRQPATVDVRVGKAIRSDGGFIVPVELRGILPSAREVTHARADVVLADRHATAAGRLAGGALLKYPMARDEVYQSVLFHGPAMRGIDQIEGSSERAIAGWVSTAPAPSEWIDRPLRSTWLTDPLAIDCAFQLVVLWCSEQLRANSLPASIGGYRQFRRSFPADGVRVLAEIRHASDTRAVADVEFLDAHGELVARLDSYECVIDSSLNQAFRRNHFAATRVE
ncbi:MAG: SDR family NAD(P)-dependent oxidoreductase [Isosphaerales bacterium]